MSREIPDIRTALLPRVGLDAVDTTVSSANVVVRWTPGGLDELQSFPVPLRPTGTETRFEIRVVSFGDDPGRQRGR